MDHHCAQAWQRPLNTDEVDSGNTFTSLTEQTNFTRAAQAVLPFTSARTCFHH